MKTLMLTMTLVIGLAYTWMIIYFPHVMLNPGELADAHKGLDQDCFACHTAFNGLPAAKCLQCHPIDRIGVLTVEGFPAASAKKRPAFHDQLKTQECMECHSDHLGRRFSPIAFSHELLADTLRQQCTTCHTQPGDRIHSNLKTVCGQCHTTNAWKPAHFDHAALGPIENLKNLNCISCHEKPIDALHKTFATTCGDCHTTNQWKPATFDHDRYFRFDRHHRTECVTCHTGNNYQSYTCYGCHEHTLSNIRSEHFEEGIISFDNCAQCHRSGNKHEAEGNENKRKNKESEEDDD
ncbi:cytochrome c3 family protein [bacterium]|nr:cytochrome c3 family protein [bacterium]